MPMFMLIAIAALGVTAAAQPLIPELSRADQALLAASATVSQRTRTLLVRGAEVLDQTGTAVGHVAAVDEKLVTIATQKSSFAVPINAVKGDTGRLILPFSAAQYDEVVKLGARSVQATAEPAAAR